ncbi:uncharacterized protein LOC109821519 [Asparagus officinalis]|uniref:uncharacterized protein LOC109821519 n=1 Tax=Asparagus officinalis TaxID=4686 RepID=UPI00098E3D96|nr:uncharacterized protein LOC109821519 [Asparagus officinalis]
MDMTCRTIFEVEGHTICRYDMLHLLRGGRLKDEIIEALVASLRTWLKLPINAHVERKYAIVTSYFSIWLLTASNLDERNVYKNYIKKHIDEGKDVLIIPICHADHWHVLEVNLGQKKCRHYSSADHEAWARDVLTIQLFLDRMIVAWLVVWLSDIVGANIDVIFADYKYDCGIHAYFFIKAILEGREVMDIEVLHRESHMLRAGLAAQIICEGREWKKLRLKLDSDDPEYLLYFGGSDAPMIEWKY